MKRNYTKFNKNVYVDQSPSTNKKSLDDFENGDDDYEDNYLNEDNYHENDYDNVENPLTEIPPESIEFQKWKRPELKELNNNQNELIFQQLDIDNYDSHGSLSQEPIFRLYGVNKSGNSIMAHVHGFYPYLYAEIDKDFNTFERSLVRDTLTNEIKNQPAYRLIENPIVSVEYCMKSNIYGYSKNDKTSFIKITVVLPKLVAVCKRLLEDGIFIGKTRQSFQIFDNNIDFSIRYMVDSGLVGCSWVQFPAGSYTLRSDNKVSLCQLEVDIDWKKIVYHPIDSQWSDIAPIRILSFDIECAGRKGVFPDPMYDTVIQISNMITRFGETEPFIKNIFTLNTCAPIVGSHVISCNTEVELLESWSKFIREVDPDIITGYNIQNFDLPYLINRAKTLKINGFPYLGRIKNAASRIIESQFKSKQMGRRENKMVHMIGRIQFDLFQILLRDYKLRSYSLNAVSFHFLEEQKEDVAHQIITDLQNGNEVTRRRLAVYCLKDSYLVLRLLNKLMCIVNYIEMARVTGVPLTYLLSRGQQIKVLSQLLRKAATHDFVLPDYKSTQGDEFIGAIVLEPKRGFYIIPIATLDFSSLYPSIMMAHNLCYTTLIKNQSMIESFGLTPNDYVRTPYGSYFVKSHIKRGLLPEILVDLIEARKKAKRELALETDPFKKQVLDGRQLALKVSANSVYGFTGAQVGRLPCLEISSSVTAYGRDMIELTKKLVEEKFTMANGYEFDSEVVYGDTDSVMCKFGVKTVSEAMQLGREAADFISGHFDKPIKLEFEKVYYPYLLINKKRYAGLYYTKPDKYDKMDCKGLETVRRDNCPLVSNLVNKCLEKLLIDRDAKSSIEYAQSVISDLLCNRVDISQLIISKELTKTDEEYSNSQAHSVLAKKMTARDPGSAPQLGDRVPYIIIAGSEKNISTRAEDPIYVLDNNLPIDTNYYLNNQLINPLLRIFEPIYKTKAKDKLTKGKHMDSKTQQYSSMGPLAKFAVIKEKCMGCNNVLTGDDKSLCNRCMPQAHNIYQKEVTYLSTIEDKFARLWTECQRCSGSLHQEVLCTSRDCPIFYMRKKVQKDIIQQDKLVQKLDEDLDW